MFALTDFLFLIYINVETHSDRGRDNMENAAAPINWYPGHMAKTKRILTEQIRKIDLVIELCDARLPHSSRNPEILRMAKGKKSVVFLNKADLAEPAGDPRGRRQYR